jgi:hypothetical protein
MESCHLGLGHEMRCLYCNKRLGLFSSKRRLFCSELHETAYHDERSGLAMRRVLDPLFTVLVEPPAIPATPDQKWSPISVPALCNLVVEQDRLKPVPPDLAALAVPLEAEPSIGPVQRPSSSSGVIAFTLDSATELAGEIEAEGNETIATRRVQSKRGRRIPPRSPAAFSSQTHRRRRR